MVRHSMLGKTFYSYYAHLAQNSVIVKDGDRVFGGQQIATAGNTGFSYGIHLHLVVFVPIFRNIGRENHSFKGYADRDISNSNLPYYDYEEPGVLKYRFYIFEKGVKLVLNNYPTATNK